MLIVTAATVAAVTSGAAGRQRDTPVTSTDLRAERANNTPVLAADPTDGRFVVLANRVDATEFDCALHASGDGGRTWRPLPARLRRPDGVDHCYAPQVVFDRQGRLYLLLVGLAGPGNRPAGVFLATSADRGRSFSDPRQLLGPGNYQVRLAIDPRPAGRGRLHLVWLEARGEPSLGSLPPPPNPIRAAHSDDGGRTWSDPVQVSDPDRDLVVAPQVAVGSAGDVHVLYYDLHADRRDYHGLEGPIWDGTWTLLHAASTDGGQTFRDSQVVTDAISPPGRVMLIFTMPPPGLATLGDGRVVAAWPDARHGDPDVLAANSADGGATWRGPVRVNDDPGGSGATQLLPTLAAADGRAEVLWLDRRRDPTGDIATDVHYSASTDGGASFGASVRVNAKAFDARTGARYPIPSAAGLVEWGSGLGLLAGGHRTVAAWPDTRHVPSGMTHQDIFATLISHPSKGASAVGPGAVAAGLTLTAGALLVVVRRRRDHPATAPGGPSAPAHAVEGKDRPRP